MIRLRILPEVATDISGAIKWYRRERPELGDKLSEAVYALMEKIAASPRAWNQVYRTFHRAHLRHFPYAVYYRIEDEEIIISLLFHTARNPTALQRILRGRKKT
jgi:plasmid stabilization system protein ParE